MIERHQCVEACYNIPGQTWPVELCWLYDTFGKSMSHIEIGTFCGRSLMASCGGMQSSASVFSVDDDSEAFNPEWVQAVRRATLKLIEQNVTAVRLDSVSAAAMCNDKFDSIYIDACHHYAECKADIQAWLPHLKAGGIIAGHDYWPAHPGVMYAVNEVFGDAFEVVPRTRIWFARPITS